LSRNVTGLFAGPFVASIEPVVPLAEVVARTGQPLAGVFMTHMHIDHVLGLPDVPKGTPIFTGPGERDLHGPKDLLFKRAIDELSEGHDFRTIDYARARPLESISAALDVFGDGSFYALRVPGHTSGSTAYLARTEKGTVLFTGDCSHTLWGFQNGVPPGIFSDDGPANARSLGALKRLAAAHPEMRVVVGHETDGIGTGIQPGR
jgi:glyoxylase-like metal-dependent hydrolase (beta-lactamase superfamily II)